MSGWDTQALDLLREISQCSIMTNLIPNRYFDLEVVDNIVELGEGYLFFVDHVVRSCRDMLKFLASLSLREQQAMSSDTREVVEVIVDNLFKRIDERLQVWRKEWHYEEGWGFIGDFD